MKKYEYWKTLVWRFVRTVLAVVAATVLAVLTAKVAAVSASTITLAYFIGVITTSLQAGFNALLFGILTGVITVLGKVIRDKLSDGDKSASIQKLPL